MIKISGRALYIHESHNKFTIMSNWPMTITGIISIILGIFTATYRVTEYIYGIPKVTIPYVVLSVPLIFFGIFMMAFGMVFFNPPHPDDEEYRTLKKQAITSFIVLVGGLILFVIIIGIVVLMLFGRK